MGSRAGAPPSSRRIYLKGLGSQVGKRLGSYVYRSPVLRRKKKLTQAQVYSTATLATAARFGARATAWELQTAKDLAGSSGYTWKDMLLSSFFGTAIEFTTSDGVLWQGRRILAAEIQPLLDSISSTPGSILVRTANGWAALYIGDPNKVLTVDPSNNLPNWLPAAGGGGGLPAIATATAFIPPPLNMHTAVTFNSGFFGGRSVWLPAGQPINAIKFLSKTAVPTAQMTPAIYADNAGALGALEATAATVTGATIGINILPIILTPATSGWHWIGYVLEVAALSVASAISNAENAFFATAGPPPNPAPASTYATGNAWNNMWLDHP